MTDQELQVFERAFDFDDDPYAGFAEEGDPLDAASEARMAEQLALVLERHPYEELLSSDIDSE